MWGRLRTALLTVCYIQSPLSLASLGARYFINSEATAFYVYSYRDMLDSEDDVAES